MDRHSKIRKILEIELEQIKLLADAVAMASNFCLRDKLLKIMNEELGEAMFWNFFLSYHEAMQPSPPFQPPYEQPYSLPYTPCYNYSEKKRG